MLAEEHLREGNLDAALEALQDDVRKHPAEAKYRTFLFQLLSVLGQWDRAVKQLKVVGELDAATLPMVQAYREALRCELLREKVFSGERSPLFFGEPEEWMAVLYEAARLTAAGENARSQELREKAFEDAPTTSGAINGEEFEWIADADTRMGPMLEAVVNGNYYWIPFHRIKDVTVDEPADLRDMVWLPAHFTWANGGDAVGLIPTRYPGSQASEDHHVRLARKTDWVADEESGVYLGLGQRILATDTGDHALLDVRSITLNTAGADEEAPAG